MSKPANTNKKKRTLEDADCDKYSMEMMQPQSKRQKQQPNNNDNNHNKVEDDEDADSDSNEDLLVGPMSPRMLYRLEVCAEISADMARDDGAGFVSCEPEYDFDGCLAEYLPVRFRKKMYKSFWMGYAQCFDAISEILKRKQAPNVSAVRQEIQKAKYDARYTRFYLNKGGIVEYAIDAIIKRSKEESVGDESFFDIPEFEQEHDALPEMKAYDFEYDMVWEDLCASTCMVFELNYGGPYETDDEPEEDEDDEDEDLNTWYQRQSRHVLQKLVQQSRGY